MMQPGLGAWLAAGAALLAWGVVAAALRRDRGGPVAGLLLMLGGVTLVLAALVRHAVLPPAGWSTLTLMLVLGGVLVLALAADDAPTVTGADAAAAEEQPDREVAP